MTKSKKAPIDPGAQQILEQVRTAGIKFTQAQRAFRENEARRERAETAWRTLASFQGNAIPRDLWNAGDALWRRHGELVCELGKILRNDGWQAAVDAIVPGPLAKQFAAAILRQALNGDIDNVTKLLKEGAYGDKAVDPFFQLCAFGLPADKWLREGLMYEVLGIDPPQTAWRKFPYESYDFARALRNEPPIPEHFPNAEQIALVVKLGLDAQFPRFEKLRGKLLQKGLRGDDLPTLSVEAILARLGEEPTANVEPQPAPTVTPAGADTGEGADDAKLTGPQWLSLAQAEKLSGINRGTITRAVDAGEIKSNGKTGKGRRKVDSADFNCWLLERAPRPEQGESEEQVEKLLENAKGEGKRNKR